MQLQYEELIGLQRWEEVISPNEIPVHPTVFNAENLYSEDFVRAVIESIPHSLQQDIATIERMLEKDLNMQVTESGIVHSGQRLQTQELQFEDINAYLSGGPSVEVQYASANIALDISQPIITKPERAHPMAIESLEEYAQDFDNEDPQILVWYTHNHLDFGLPLKLYFRNFAIMWNNLGLESFEGK